MFLQRRNIAVRVLAIWLSGMSAVLAIWLSGMSAVLAAEHAPTSKKAALPPELPWSGATRDLMVPADDPWITPSEASDLTTTPSYEETFSWLDRLVEASPELEKISVGSSRQGREIWMVLASKDKVFTPQGMHASEKPTLLAHAGIHAGEIDGKDAGLMLLRDMTVRGTLRKLLDGANLLFIPILNVDGHERSTPHGRINQRGPEQMGWRTNARNLNLNRDFAKLDTPELRALVNVINAWQPDLYVDLHVTDGADYQYDITFGFTGEHGHSPSTAAWLETRLAAAARRDLEARGHVPGPLIFFMDPRDPEKGMFGWTASPRFSNGYGDARHLPTILVENHSLKPYAQRVLGTRVFLETTMRTLAKHGKELRRAVESDRARRPATVPLAWKVGDAAPGRIDLLGVASHLEPSPISGGVHLEWTGKPIELSLPLLNADQPASTAERPAAYWVPATWPEVIERLAIHGVEMERITEWRELEVDMYRLEDAKLNAAAFEGHARVSSTPVLERRTERFPPGSARVPTDQPLGTLAMLLLEPASPDSFFQWGFFLEVLQRTEYFEEYVMEPMARRMLAEDPALADEFRNKLMSDADFAGSQKARLEWFYRKTPYFDDRWKLYPVARESRL